MEPPVIEGIPQYEVQPVSLDGSGQWWMFVVQPSPILPDKPPIDLACFCAPAQRVYLHDPSCPRWHSCEARCWRAPIVMRDNGDWILDADEYEFPILFCPYCGMELPVVT